MDRTSALLLLALTLLPCHARRSLTEVTYRFTNCESTNHDGPRVIQECLPLYQRMGSPIANPGTLFQFEEFDGEFDGAQGFRLPRADLYNITVAGASGGEGVCNYHYGRGGVISAQVRLTTDYEYLIMVGHRGTSVCDVPANANHPICQLPRPTNLNEAQACNSTWLELTGTSQIGRGTYNFNGGGGGGGASIIRPRRLEDGVYLSPPLAIGSGGGGASALLNYEYLARAIPENFSHPRNATSMEIYRFHVDSHSSQYYLNWEIGISGTRLGAPDQLSSGAGGGWEDPPIELFQPTDVDGETLSQQRNFAQGGFGCPISSGSNQFLEEFGGYGGGGGGCGSGGGGGGYTGGQIISNDNRIPGGGGDFSQLFDHAGLSIVKVLSEGSFHDGDGYVEIVASNCGCDGECVVYTEERQFECQCPNGTLLAEDGSSCFIEATLAVEEGELIPSEEDLFIRDVFLMSPVHLLSLRTNVLVEPATPRQEAENQPIRCVMVLFGEESNYALLSNTVSGSTHISGSGTIDSLSVVTLDLSGNITMKSDPVTMLESPLVVSGMALVSNGDCQLTSPVMRANISALTSDIVLSNDTETIEDNIIINIANTALTKEATVKPQEVSVLVGATVGTVLGITMVIIIIAAVVGVMCYKRRKRSKSTLLHELSIQRQHVSPGTGALNFNSAYSLYHESSRFPANSMDHTYETIEVAYTIEGVIENRQPSSKQGANAQFQPVHGITTPQVDFWSFNRGRANSIAQNWSYPRSNLTYMKELGEGQFGKVLLMKAKDIAGYEGSIPVAVKTLSSKDPDTIQKFIEEADLMKRFCHPNIVSLLGFIRPEEGEDSAPLMILEYMQYGDLRGFLESNRPGPNKPSLVKKMHFYTFSYDIAQGLEFLSQHKYVHRDIAARNCLVGSGLQIKIADFGLARGVNNKDYYRIAGSAVLPVRWMSPESLLLGKFTTASDVWAYGVVIWEILMFGQLPLPNMDTQHIIKKAQNNRLEHSRPRHAPEDLCELMSRCHQLEVEDRPTFVEIVEMELFNVVIRRPPIPSSEPVNS